jgi:hypothetical protein
MPTARFPSPASPTTSYPADFRTRDASLRTIYSSSTTSTLIGRHWASSPSGFRGLGMYVLESVSCMSRNDSKNLTSRQSADAARLMRLG